MEVMETENIKRKRNSNVSSSKRSRVDKSCVLKTMRENFSSINDGTNKSSERRSILSNSCDYIDENNSQSGNQQMISDIIKLEPNIDLDFLSEDDGTTFSNNDERYEEDFEIKEGMNSEETHPSEYHEIRTWAIDNDIPENNVQDLIDILRKNVMPDLPKTAREFLDESNSRKISKQKNVTITGNEFQILMSKLTTMQNDIRNISNNQKCLQQLVLKKKNSQKKNSDLSFSDKYFLELPLRDLEGLFAFETTLAQNHQCRKDFIASLSFLLEDRLSRSALAVMRKFLHRDVVLKCTAVKQMEGKFVMKLDVPTFWHSIVDLLMKYHKVTEKEVHSSLGTVLTNAKDWDGKRAQRDMRLLRKSISE